MVQRFLKLVILLLALGQMGASCHGTETGNPQHAGACPALTTEQEALGTTQVLDDLISDLCQKIILCGVGSTNTCVNTLNGPDGDLMTDELGLTVGTTIDQLRAELISGAVIASATQEPICIDALKAISCDTVTANVSSSDFSGVENIMPASCDHAFVSIQASTELPTTGGCP